jgi:hypothetical protein
MKKLSLTLDDLQIESFETTSEKADDSGSVEAYQTPTANSGGSCFEFTCRPAMCRTDETCIVQSCNPTCAYTCDDHTCAYTCDDPGCGG